jgi:hypothetical protein
MYSRIFLLKWGLSAYFLPDFYTKSRCIILNSQDQFFRSARPVASCSCGVVSGGRYKSTMHRVVPKIGDQARLSIAVFIDPDSDTLVETVPGCISADNPARFAPMTAGEHLQSRLAASHKGQFDR